MNFNAWEEDREQGKMSVYVGNDLVSKQSLQMKALLSVGLVFGGLVFIEIKGVFQKNEYSQKKWAAHLIPPDDGMVHNQKNVKD